jgi:hypothetical protein
MVQAGKTVTEAATNDDLPLSPASDLWKKFQDTGTTHNRPCSGGPWKVGTCLKRQFIRSALQNCRKPFNELAHDAPAPALFGTFPPKRDTIDALLARYPSSLEITSCKGYHGHECTRNSRRGIGGNPFRRMSVILPGGREGKDLCDQAAERTERQELCGPQVQTIINPCDGLGVYCMGNEGTIGCPGIYRWERRGNEHTTVYFSSPGAPPQTILSEDEERTTSTNFPAGWSPQSHKQGDIAMVSRQRDPVDEPPRKLP